MIAGLERFVRELRAEGLSASPGEWLDALRAAQHVGLADRARFRLALRLTLAKRSRQQAVFDRVFERFFTAPAHGGGRVTEPRGAIGAARGGPRSEPRQEAGARPPTRSAPSTPPAPTPSLLMSRLPAPRLPAPHLPTPHLPTPHDLLRRIEIAREGGPERRGRLRHVVVAVRSAERVGGPRVAGPDLPAAPERRDLRQCLGTEDEREIAAEVPRLVERIRLRSGRRLARAAHGPLYLRRVFRENATHGGIPFVLPHRRTRPRRSRVVLLIDVSWSSARAAGLFLSIAHEFLRRRRDTRVLLFVDRVVDATLEIERWQGCRPESGRRPAGPQRTPGAGIVRGGTSFADVLTTLGELNLDAPSDYGRTFHQLLQSRMRPAGRNTLLLVLGDGRTNRFDPQDWAFEEIAGRCGAVLWLVPEDPANWTRGDSALAAYLPHADVAVEASDLEGLGRGVAEMVRRL